MTHREELVWTAAFGSYMAHAWNKPAHAKWVADRAVEELNKEKGAPLSVSELALELRYYKLLAQAREATIKQLEEVG